MIVVFERLFVKGSDKIDLTMSMAFIVYTFFQKHYKTYIFIQIKHFYNY